MSKKEIYDSVMKVIHDCMPDMDISGFTPETVLADTEIESMGMMLIICRLEAVMDIRIPDERWMKLQSLNDVIDEIEKALAAKEV